MEWIFALYLGTQHTLAAPLTLDQPSLGTSLRIEPVAYRGNSFRPPLYYGYRVTAFPNRGAWLGVEAEVIHLKVYALTDREAIATGVHRSAVIGGPVPVNRIIQALSISHGLNLALVNLVARRSVGDSRLRLAGRLGAGPTIAHPESTIDGESSQGYEWGGIGAHAAVGVEVGITHGFSVLAEYKLTRAAQAVTVHEGTVRSTYRAHHAVVGVAWHSQ